MKLFNLLRSHVKPVTFFAAAFAMILFMGGITAKADVIFEPEDSFFRKHSDECASENRTYICNGPDGETTSYKSPESGKVRDKISNGKQIYIYYVYTDKERIEWGYYEDYVNDITAWIPMPYLANVYDEEMFCSLNSSSFSSEDGSIVPEKEGKLYLYQYPSSDNSVSWEVPEEGREDYEVWYSTVFTDETGKKWGKVNYFFGVKKYWVCIDNPLADFNELYPDGAPERKLEEVAEYSGEKIVPGSSNLSSGDENTSDDSDSEITPQKSSWDTIRTILIIMFIVALVVFIAAKVLLCVQKRMRNKQSRTSEDNHEQS